MAKLSNSDLLDAFKEMTLLELSDFVKQFEETFDVKAAATFAALPTQMARLAAALEEKRQAESGPAATEDSAQNEAAAADDGAPAAEDPQATTEDSTED